MTYAADGSWNVHMVDGLTYTGLYATDGSTNAVTAVGAAPCGYNHPCGGIWVTTSPGTTVPRQAPDGSLYINTTLSNDGSQKVTLV